MRIQFSKLFHLKTKKQPCIFTQKSNELKGPDRCAQLFDRERISCVMVFFFSTRHAEPIYRPLRSMHIQQNVTAKHNLLQFDLDIWPTTLTCNPNLAKFKVDPHTKYQGQMSNHSSRRAQTDKWSNGQTNGRYQTYYLPSFAVDKDTVFELLRYQLAKRQSFETIKTRKCGPILKRY